MRSSDTKYGKLEAVGFYLLLFCIVVLFVLQLRSLYTTPIADSYLWWGDESWLMLEFRSQILHGVFRHPYALGSTLYSGNGILFSNMWIPAILYGIPAALFEHADIISVGRTMTALLSIGLALLLFCVTWRLAGSRLAAAFAVLLLITSRGFFLTSHSARYDILNAACILAGAFYLLTRKTISQKEALWIGIFSIASLFVTIHVTIALYAAAAFAVVAFARSNRARMFVVFLLGSAVGVLLLAVAGTIENRLSLFASSGASAYQSNLLDIPLLRPFSRSVQSANLLQKFERMESLALGCLIVLGVVVISVIARNAKLSVPVWWKKAVLIPIIGFAWLLGESSAPPSYIIYVLPLFAVVCALGIATFRPAISIFIILVGGVLLSVVAARDAMTAEKLGEKITAANSASVERSLTAVTPNAVVLAFNPAIHEVLRDSAVHLMTTHFIEFPASALDAWSVLKANHAQFALIYKSSLKPDYMREVGPTTALLHDHGTLVSSTAGPLTDIGRSYFAPVDSGSDTLQLYTLHD